MPETGPEPTCGNCHTSEMPDKLLCKVCAGAPSYVEGHGPSAEPIYYCSQQCMDEQAENHQSTCVVLETRIKLQRLADLLKEMIVAIRRHAFEPCLDSIEVRRPYVILKYDGETHDLRTKLARFPAGMATDPEIFDAVLLQETNGYIILYLRDFLLKFVQGLPQNELRIMTHVIKNAMLSVEFHKLRASYGALHSVLNILVNGETWVLDPTGGQYGWGNAILPIRVHCEERVDECKKIERLLELTPAEALDGRVKALIRQAKLAEMPPERFKNVVIYDAVMNLPLMGLKEKLNASIVNIEEDFGGSLGNVLSGLDSEFQAKKRRFISSIDGVVCGYMANLYPEGQIEAYIKQARKLYKKTMRAMRLDVNEAFLEDLRRRVRERNTHA